MQIGAVCLGAGSNFSFSFLESKQKLLLYLLYIRILQIYMQNKGLMGWACIPSNI